MCSTPLHLKRRDFQGHMGKRIVTYPNTIEVIKAIVQFPFRSCDIQPRNVILSPPRQAPKPPFSFGPIALECDRNLEIASMTLIVLPLAVKCVIV